MKNFLKKYKFQILLLLITALLFWVNYSPGTYLSGWDNLQTELNPSLAVKRAFFSVWEEYQSFGLTAGMAHASDLVRAVFLWIVSFVIPQNIIRYFYHFLMLFLGGMGLMSLMGLMGIAAPYAFLGALFYLLNLGTVQIFYVPFESFSTFFAFLPWGIWVFMRLMRPIGPMGEKKKNLWLFFLINLLGTPAFYTQQLFLVYITILFSITISFLPLFYLSSIDAFINNFKQQLWKRSFRLLTRITFLFILIFIINSFWIFPQLYFLKTNSDWIYQAKANQIATEDVYYQNYEKGTLDKFLILEGFYYDLKGINHTPLFQPWKNHFQGLIKFLPWFFALLMLIGLTNTVINLIKKQKNNPIDYSFMIIFFLCALMLLPATWTFSWINESLRNITILNQIFRSPFTKWIIPYSLIYSFFVIKGLSFIFYKLHSKKQTIHYLILTIIFVLLIIYSLPSFKGFFISLEMKVKIPQEYFQIIDYFKKQDKNIRIGLLPEYTHWGWYFHKWRYNGSGFLWYGIEQPIISRTFDTWNHVSESYFWEIKKALEDENLDKFEKILNKYQINYLLLDKSLIPVSSTYKALQYERTENLINQSKIITPVLKHNYFHLYQVKIPHDNFLTIKSDLISVEPKIKITNDDTAYYENLDYYNSSNSLIYYPFLDLTTQTRIFNKNWQIEENQNKIIIKIKINQDLLTKLDNYDISFNPFYQTFFEDKNYQLKIDFYQQEDNFIFSFDKILLKEFTGKKLVNNDVAGFFLDKLDHKYGYLIKIKNKNLSGRNLFFYINELTKDQVILEERLKKDLEYFILPEKYKYGMDYAIVFNNQSYNNLKSINQLENIEIFLFPYRNLKDFKLVDKNYFYLKNIQKQIPDYYYQTKKNNYYSYQIKLNQPIDDQNAIILYQSFSPGWLAYQVKNDNWINRYFPFLFGKKLENHVLVNNWANGWIIDEKINPKNIVIIFWPQYLQFLGFGLLIIAFLFILLYKPKNQN